MANPQQPEVMVEVGNVVNPAPILFIDMRERDVKARQRLENERYHLQEAEKEHGSRPDIVARLKEIETLLQQGVCDPFFVAVQANLESSCRGLDPLHRGGLLASQQPPTGQIDHPELSAEERTVAAVFGLLSSDNVTEPDSTGRFAKAVSVALGEYAGSRALYDAVLRTVSVEGLQHLDLNPIYPDGQNAERRAERFRVVRTPQWVGVARALRREGVTADDVQLAAKARTRFHQLVSSTGGGVPSAVGIDLPDLEAHADLEIQADNVRAMQALHFAAMLDELKLFQVVDKLVELFHQGLLPLGRGRAGDLLYGYWKKATDRLSEFERRNLYARCFGMAGGDPSIGNPNREFGDLFIRFCSAVSEYVRQFSVDDLLRSSIPFRVSEEHVRKSGRDLGANLSLHGYGIAHFAAAELQDQLNEIISILSDPEVKSAYGARDMWQMVDQVATLELGGARNGIRYRTMATSGAVVIRWIAEHGAQLAGGYGTPLLDMLQVRRPAPRPAGTKATTHPTDRDLVDAVEQWLAVTGTPDTRVQEYAQPVESPNMTSRPIAIPQVARDLLDSVGISAGYEGGNGDGYAGAGSAAGPRFSFR